MVTPLAAVETYIVGLSLAHTKVLFINARIYSGDELFIFKYS